MPHVLECYGHVMLRRQRFTVLLPNQQLLNTFIQNINQESLMPFLLRGKLNFKLWQFVNILEYKKRKNQIVKISKWHFINYRNNMTRFKDALYILWLINTLFEKGNDAIQTIVYIIERKKLQIVGGYRNTEDTTL